MHALKILSTLALGLLIVNTSWAQSECKPHPAGQTKVVKIDSRMIIMTVEGQLAEFNPCHKSVKLDTPAFFAPKLGEKPPVVIVLHGGGGLGPYQKDFAKLMNQNGYATLIFDAFEMNGLQSWSDMIRYSMSNGARQRMIFKAALGAFEWVRSLSNIDGTKIFIQGLSNGGAVAINMAAAIDEENLLGVIAEGAPTAGIGLPDEIKASLILIYGAQDNYGGRSPDELLFYRTGRCFRNDFDPLAPIGFAKNCNITINRRAMMPSPEKWYQDTLSKGHDIQLELVEGGGHGIMFDEFSSRYIETKDGNKFYITLGGKADTRKNVEKIVLDFMSSKI